MKIGVLWKSTKENEKRYPIYWEHLYHLQKHLIESLFFEEGYPGLEFLSSDYSMNILKREKIFESCDLIILPKITSIDFHMFKNNQILWGWLHNVQDTKVVNLAIEKKMTLIAWENMYLWKNNVKKEHIFARNNELAGYAAVNHFMELSGITPGVYGKEVKIAILGYGSTAKGAINSLLGLGATDITVFSKRSKFQIIDAIKNIKYKIYKTESNTVYLDGKLSHLELLKYDLIVNCILQDPLNPINFITEKDIKDKKLNIIDISCDYRMGFDFAKSTTFHTPIIETPKYRYYAVDHTPSYYWNAASYEISGALLTYLQYILENGTYQGNITLERAMDINNGQILNKAIIKYQNRESEHPYKIK